MGGTGVNVQVAVAVGCCGGCDEGCGAVMEGTGVAGGSAVVAGAGGRGACSRSSSTMMASSPSANATSLREALR
jgi:hypothetical protein